MTTVNGWRASAHRLSKHLVGKVAVGGTLVSLSEASAYPTEDPSTEDVLGLVLEVGKDDVDRVVESATAAQMKWERESWESRAQKVAEVADRILSEKSELAALDSLDGGNPLRASLADVTRASAHLRYMAGLGPELKGTVYGWPGSPIEELRMSRREPFGVVGILTAFNHPLLFSAIGLGAPLMAGNAVILKPADNTTLSTLRLAEIIGDLLPDGLVNVLTGSGPGVGAVLASHPGIRRVALTGSLAAGQAVLRAASETIKRVTLELGGKNPMIVLPDVDVRSAASAAVKAMNLRTTAGQSCGSTSRILVHESISEEFVRCLTDDVAAMRVGDPFDDATDMGPLSHRRHYERVRAYIAAGRDSARMVIGGGRPDGLERGFYVQPTVFADVKPGASIANEEIFGPVMCVIPWSRTDEAIEIANGTAYGLTANIWTNDLRQALQMAEKVQAGFVWVNGSGQRPLGVPFGGYKSSGLGRDSGLEEILGYTQEKTILLSYGSPDH